MAIERFLLCCTDTVHRDAEICSCFSFTTLILDRGASVLRAAQIGVTGELGRMETPRSLSNALLLTGLHRVSKMIGGTWCSWFITFASHFRDFAKGARLGARFNVSTAIILFFVPLLNLV